MRCYHIYYFASCHYRGSESFEADNDFEAAAAAGRARGVTAAELWCGERKVRVWPAVERQLLSAPAPPLPLALSA